ncbi:hypothetical protein H5410_064093 [Solanum commersonii]|uniref:S-protein homolog n=1 Tax=Solanum commersonii TaxID=4109 RepID=A0A9J5W169_SOLCO|nr:hypothetical protein H5410_064093 [Solanum commersonii]
MSSSPHHHFVLCLFLVSFLCVNSQLPHDVFTVIIKNETPSVVTRYCTVHGEYLNEDQGIELKPGEVNNITGSIVPGRNTFVCLLELEEKRKILNLFDSDDTSICHVPNKVCVWKIQEDGLCMLSEGKCVMFGWDYNSLSNRHTASEPTKYIASDELKSENIIWRRTP